MRDEVRVALMGAGQGLRTISTMVPGPAGMGLRLGAALIGGLVTALDKGETAESLLQKLTGEPLPDINEGASAQDEAIDRLIEERFGPQ